MILPISTILLGAISSHLMQLPGTYQFTYGNAGNSSCIPGLRYIEKNSTKHGSQMLKLHWEGVSSNHDWFVNNNCTYSKPLGVMCDLGDAKSENRSYVMYTFGVNEDRIETKLGEHKDVTDDVWYHKGDTIVSIGFTSSKLKNDIDSYTFCSYRKETTPVKKNNGFTIFLSIITISFFSTIAYLMLRKLLSYYGDPDELNPLLGPLE